MFNLYKVIIEGTTMKIHCISCQSLFRLDSNLVKPTGSLVRCSKCMYIFMVYPPGLNDEPNMRDTNIDQSILFDLFKAEQNFRDRQVIDQNSAVITSYRPDEIASIEDSKEEDEYPEVAEDFEYGELPDLSEYEKMIDWDELPDVENRSDDEIAPL